MDSYFQYIADATTYDALRFDFNLPTNNLDFLVQQVQETQMVEDCFVPTIRVPLTASYFGLSVSLTNISIPELSNFFQYMYDPTDVPYLRVDGKYIQRRPYNTGLTTYTHIIKALVDEVRSRSWNVVPWIIFDIHWNYAHDPGYCNNCREYITQNGYDYDTHSQKVCGCLAGVPQGEQTGFGGSGSTTYGMGPTYAAQKAVEHLIDVFASYERIAFEPFNEPFYQSVHACMQGVSSEDHELLSLRDMVVDVQSYAVNRMLERPIIIMSGCCNYAWICSNENEMYGGFDEYKRSVAETYHENVMLGLHQYMGPYQSADNTKTADGFFDIVALNRAAGNALITTEWGQYCCGQTRCFLYDGSFGPGNKSMSYTEAVLTVNELYGVGWTGWAARPLCHAQSSYYTSGDAHGHSAAPGAPTTQSCVDNSVSEHPVARCQEPDAFALDSNGNLKLTDGFAVYETERTTQIFQNRDGHVTQPCIFNTECGHPSTADPNFRAGANYVLLVDRFVHYAAPFSTNASFGSCVSPSQEEAWLQCDLSLYRNYVITPPPPAPRPPPPSAPVYSGHYCCCDWLDQNRFTTTLGTCIDTIAERCNSYRNVTSPESCASVVQESARPPRTSFPGSPNSWYGNHNEHGVAIVCGSPCP